MPENPQNKKRGWLATMIWKTYPEIEQAAARYSTTSLVKSDWAYLIYFFLATTILMPNHKITPHPSAECLFGIGLTTP
jgi:hypothetical protein